MIDKMHTFINAIGEKLLQKLIPYLTICMFSALLFVLFHEIYEKNKQKPLNVVLFWLENKIWDESGLAYTPSTELTKIGKLGEKTLYAYKQKIDPFGNRHTPQGIDAGRANKTVAFFGCSYVEGVGVRDGFTLPAQFAKLNPQIKVANYGKAGWGPNYVYLLMHQKDLTQHLTTEKVLGLHLFYNFHIDRLRMSTETLSWAGKAPYFELNTEDHAVSKITHRGKFFEVRPWPYSIYFLLSKMSWFKSLHPHLLKTKPTDIELTATLLFEASKKFRQTFPNSKFLTIFMDPLNPRSQQVQALFEKSHEDFLILKADLQPEIHEIKDDGHYTEVGNQYFAELISDQIKDYL